ncbi:MAG: Rieske 2Fe-2S domain-containing protein [Acidimicrobiaceae bacterium]|nr:Rieske 2Fe-2S domain-containing protein [Acidimicrobiaceae bacterium]MYF43365.1 Rieske 2Fe-2S domain-containing protein [Acidimicrobiaceae bacterium]
MWHPVASAHDVPHRHVYHGQLLGRELAVWRADDDYVNVWENRCLHRGVRLSIGSNDGTELRCQYHGWRYANRSAGCTYIPAHPADAPARTICNRTFPSVERYGLVWSGEEPVGEPPTIELLEAGTPFGLRNLPVHAPAELAIRHLQGHRFLPSGRLGAGPAASAGMSVEWADEYSVALTATDADTDNGSAGSASTAVFFVQPVDSGRSVIRAVLAETPAASEQLAVLRHHATELNGLVARIEAEAALLPAPEPMVPVLQQVPLHLAEVPEAPSGRQAALRVQVRRKWETAAGVAAFELAPIEGVLPTFQPGAHIDVHLPNGLVRQYSITNGPGETSYYRLGVKLEPDSTGGSVCLHKTVREGDVLAISEPRNNFPLRRDSMRTILLAGGIGITPLLAMAQALDRMSLPFELHCFAQSAEHTAFSDVLDGLGESVVRHLGLPPDETVAEIRRLVAAPDEFTHVYVCGPGPMLEAARREAADAGWPDDHVHFEYFKNTTEIDDSSTFEVALARSALTVTVPSGSTILEVLRESGVPLPSSCEQGACGTCVATVLEGEPDHQDVYLNDSDHEAGDRIMTCVSRALSDRLVLDL